MHPGMCDGVGAYAASSANVPKKLGGIVPSGCLVPWQWWLEVAPRHNSFGGGCEGQGLLVGGSWSERVARHRRASAARDQVVRGTVEVASACYLSPRAASASSKDPSLWRWRERGSNPLVTLRSCAALTGCLASQCVCSSAKWE